MTRGSFADTEWRGSVPMVISYLVTLMFVTQVASAAFTIFFEGISLSITLREVFGGMVDKRNGDIELFIQDLNASEGA